MRRTGLGRHGGLDSDAGDPLDGLVNLFDLGIVLAIGFLVAGLSLVAKHKTTRQDAASTTTQTLAAPSGRQASGSGKAVGQVYQLPGGQLVLVKPR